uniref:carcinoembryonic antigen-related cell adhesion molecule 5-like n=1 Tax=Myxine glutinosa TaxID=7769 RepID=UPI00358ED620
MFLGPACSFQGSSAVRTLRVLGFLLFVFVGFSPVFAEIMTYTPEPNLDVLIGHDALLSVSFTSLNIPVVRWNFLSNDDESSEINSFNVSDPTDMLVVSSHEGRLIGHSNGSLTLKKVSNADAGTYTVSFVTYSSEGNKNTKIILHIYDTLTHFFIVMEPDPPVLGPVKLTCQTNSSLESTVYYNWTFNGKAGEGVPGFTIDGSSLMVNVTETMRGFFVCSAWNPRSQHFSEARLLEANCTEWPDNSIHQMINVLQGNSAIFHINVMMSNFFAIEWIFRKLGSQVAVAMINESSMVSEGYAGRAEINKSNGSLTLLEVKQSDAGSYFANVSSCKKRWQEVFELKVKDPINTAALIGGLVGGIGLLLLLLLALAVGFYCCRKNDSSLHISKIRSKIFSPETIDTGTIKDISDIVPTQNLPTEGRNNDGFLQKPSYKRSCTSSGENDLSKSTLESSVSNITSEIHDYRVVKTEPEVGVKIRSLTIV